MSNLMILGHACQGPVKFRQIDSTSGEIEENFYGFVVCGEGATLSTLAGRGGEDLLDQNESGDYYPGIWYPCEGTKIEVDDGEVVIYLSGR